MTPATREIVIVDFHRFPVGFGKKRHPHNQLVKMLQRHLGQYMAPSASVEQTTMDTLWQANKTLIVSYADDRTRASHPLLWPSIRQVRQKQIIFSIKMYDNLLFLNVTLHRSGGTNVQWKTCTRFYQVCRRSMPTTAFYGLRWLS